MVRETPQQAPRQARGPLGDRIWMVPEESTRMDASCGLNLAGSKA